MSFPRFEHLGIVVDDLPGAVAFFSELGLKVEGEASLEDPAVDRITGLRGVRSDVAMMRTPTVTRRSSCANTTSRRPQALIRMLRPTCRACAMCCSR